MSCASDCSHCEDIEKKSRARALVKSQRGEDGDRVEESKTRKRDRPEYYISRGDKNYSKMRRQIELVNETSLDLENYIPFDASNMTSFDLQSAQKQLKRRRLNQEESKEEEDVGEFDLEEALRQVDEDVQKER